MGYWNIAGVEELLQLAHITPLYLTNLSRPFSNNYKKGLRSNWDWNIN